jgi:tol-pal system protein YbgF
MGSVRSAFVIAWVACAAVAAPAAAQNVADIRAELQVLDGQIQQLRDQLVQQGASGGLPTDPATALTRLDQLDAELRRLTDRVEVLTNDIGRIVADASNKVGDIEFRLTELEGGEPVPKPAEPVLLGGGLTRPMPRPPAFGAQAPGSPSAPAEMTVTEQSDFDAAVAAADAGDNAKAAQLFESFLATYPGGPLSSEAQFRRAEALAAQADWQAAARSYLDAFSGAPRGPRAPRALYGRAVALGERGQVEEACLTLTEVDSRYPGSVVAGDVAAKRTSLRCQ